MAIDGSAGGFEAVRVAGRLLSAARDQIAFYYSPPGVSLDSTGPDDPQLIERARQAVADVVFNEAKSRLPTELQAKFEKIVGMQSPALEVVAAAAAWNAELIVVGARGLGPIRRLLVGSVSRAVVHQSTVPVLVVRPHQHAERPFKALLAAETAVGGEKIAQVLRQFTWPAGSLGSVVSVAEPMFAGEMPKWLADQARSPETEAMSQVWVVGHESELKDKLDEMTRLCQQLPEPFQATSPLVVEGYPAEKILEAAAKEEADLVALGARDIGAVSRLLLGSTSEAVLSQATCSVLVVPMPEGS